MKRLMVISAALMVCACANAHFLWLELPKEAPDKVLLRFSEGPGEKTPKGMQEKAKPMAVKSADGKLIEMGFGEESLSGTINAGPAVVGGSLTYGVLDKESEGRGVFLLNYCAKAVREVEASGKSLGLPGELTAKVAGGTLQVWVTKDGKPVEKAEYAVSLPGEKEPAEAYSDAEGKASFPMGTEGWIGVRVMVPEQQKGELDGKKYELVRNYSTLTFYYAPSGK